MEIKEVRDKVHFGNIYNITSYVQNHTLINRGITTLGGSTVPQCIMSNNKDESIERATMGGIYFIASYLTPILLLPLYNKHFLKNKGITKSLDGLGKKIIEVPKRFLTPDGDLKKGLSETAKNIDIKTKTNNCQDAFNEIYDRYNNSQELKKDLLKVQEKVLTTDFITTAAMWSAIPIIATEMTEKRTNRKDFSAGFNLKKDTQSNDKELSKTKKILSNIALCVIPGVLFPKLITKGLSQTAQTGSKNIINKLSKKLTKNPDKFDYTSGTNMSKTIYASIWLLSSFPAKLISARDKNEKKDRAIRDAGLFTMFFGGDYLINNILGRTADKLLGTKVMNTDKYKGKDLNFFEKFKLPIRNVNSLNSLENITEKTLRKTKTATASIYWASLITNTALIGFALPKILNKYLRHNIQKENENTEQNFKIKNKEFADRFIDKKTFMSIKNADGHSAEKKD